MRRRYVNAVQAEFYAGCCNELMKIDVIIICLKYMKMTVDILTVDIWFSLYALIIVPI